VIFFSYLSFCARGESVSASIQPSALSSQPKHITAGSRR
jgi:hypothetical protein